PGTLTQNEMTVRYLWLPSSAVASSPLRHYEPLTPTPVPLTEESSVHDLLSLGLIKVGGEGYDPMTGTVDIPDDSGKSWKVHLLVAGAALCSNARLLQLTGPSRWQEIGDPTEAALLVVATKAGLDLEQLHVQAPRLREVPFDSRRRMMTVVLDWHAPDLWPSDVPYLAFTKGAPLEVLRCCTSILRDDQAEELSHADWEHIVTTNDALARQGFRLLAVAVRRGGKELLAVNSHELERDLTFLGLVAMFDPPHPEVPEAIARCHTAGLTVTMITGDYSLTAEAIARQIGLTHGQMRAVTGESIDRLSDAQFRQVLKYGTGLVFARMSPEHKLRVVQTYKDLGAVVAVTGDGVNDAPALRTAHIGIAMGRNGTDVAREAADLVLTDDNFTTIVSAVEQGRAIYSNIRKFMTYILASNVPEIVPFLAMVAFNIPPALTIMQILAIDLGTDLVPALALGAEPAEPGSMERPARAKSEFLLSRALLLRAYGFLGMIEATLAMCGFFFVWWSYEYTLADLQAVTPALLAHTADAAVLQIYQQATTMTLAVIVACQVGNLFACRSDRLSALRVTWTRNWLLWVGIAVECLTLVALIYVPPLSRILGTAPLAPGQWLLLGVCPLVMCIAEELRKRTVRRMHSLPG
ncbi:MAG: cation-translocating P-type ATPase, partial [Candidatus Binatia bacterium]